MTERCWCWRNRRHFTPVVELMPPTQTAIVNTMEAIDRQISATADEASRAQTARPALLDANGGAVKNPTGVYTSNQHFTSVTSRPAE